MSKNKGVKTAIAAATALSALTMAGQVLAAPASNIEASQLVMAKAEKNKCKGMPKAGYERCFGIVKAGKNACKTAVHQCAGLAKVSGSPNEWIDLPKGTCEKIVGGSLKRGPKDEF